MTSGGLDDLDLGAIRLFLGALELGSVSKAASRAGITQPSATARLQKLERQLGSVLLERSPTGSVATDAGAVMAPACAEMLTMANRLAGIANDVRSAAARLRLAATRTVVDHVLPPWLADAPLRGVTIDLTEADTVGVARAVREGRVTVGLCDGPAAPLGLRSEIVGSVELAAVVAPDHPLGTGRTGSIRGERLAAADLVLRAPGSGTRDVIESALARHQPPVAGRRIEVSTNAAARLAAVNGSGVAIVPIALVAEDIAAGRLRRLHPVGVTFDQPVRLLWKGTRPATEPAQALYRYLRSHGSEDR
jgi:DNA-binding transcriptional LysR family regulator